MRSSHRILAALLTIAAIAGCDSDGRTRPPQTELRFLNVAPSHVGLFFYREERNTTGNDGALPFGGARSFRFDSDTYDFSVRQGNSWDTVLTTLAEIREAIDDQSDYYVVATEAGGDVELLFFEQPVSDAGVTMQLVHAAENQPPVDAYFVTPGADPAGATAIGSVAFREGAYAAELPDGDRQLVLTAVSDASTVLFRSDTITVPEEATLLVAIAEENGLGTAEFGVYVADNAGQRLVDSSDPAAIRVINAVSDTLDRDVYVDDDFTTPLVAGATFATVGPYQPIDGGTPDLTVTPAGNPGVEEVTRRPTIVAGRIYTSVIGGNPSDEVLLTTITEDHRSIDGVARVQIINAEHAFENLSYYILEPGTSVTSVFPTVGLAADGGNAFLSLEPNDYELTLRDPVTATVVAGPIDLTLDDGSVQVILATDAPGASTVDVLVYDPRTP